MKQLDATLLRKSVILYIAIAMVILVIVTATTTVFLQKHRQDQREQYYNNQIDKGMKHTINRYFKDYTYRVRRMVETTSSMVQMIEQRDREGLYNFLKQKWEIMKEEEEYLNIMHIHLADGTSFLRMHNKDYFGDELSSIRPMIKEIHSSHKTIKGYETGKYSSVYRVIYPIFDKEQHYIGAMEIGINPNFILNAIAEINGFCGLMFIEESSLKLYSKPSDIIIDGYRLQSKMTPKLKEICGAIKAPKHLRNSIKIKVGDTIYITHLFLLNDFEGKTKVKIIFFQDISEAGLFRGYLIFVLSITVLFVILILVWFIYRRLDLYQKDVAYIYKEQIKKINKSEKELYNERNKLKSIFNAMEDGVYVVDENYDIEYVNPALTKDFGDYHGRKCYEYFHSKSEVCSWCKNSDVQEGKTVRWEWHSDVNGKTYDLIDTPLYNSDGTISKLELFRDISENRRIKDELLYNQNYFQSIFDVTPNIMITTDGEEIDRTNPAMLEFFGYKDTQSFKNEHNCICDYFLDDSECLHAIMGEFSWLEYILDNRDELHKVCMMKGDDKYLFIVIAISLEIDEKSRSIVFFNDITKVEKLGTMLNNIINSVQNIIFVKDNEFRYLECNEAFEKFIGISKDDLIGQNDYNFFNKELADFFRNKDKEMLASGKTQENYEWVTYPDGREVYLLTTKSPLRNADGNILGLVGNSVDLTMQKELEDRLIENEKIYLDFFEHTKSANIIYTTDDNGKTFTIKALNNMVEKIENVKRDEVVGKSVEDVFKGIEEFGLLDIFQEVYSSANPHKMPITMYKDEKLHGWRENYIFKLSNGDIVASYEDRTQEKKLEIELTSSEHQFEMFMKNIPALVFIKDENSCLVYANDNVKTFFKNKEILGLKVEDFLSKEEGNRVVLLDKDILKFGVIDRVEKFTNYEDETAIYRFMGFTIQEKDIKKIGIVMIDITQEFNLRDELANKEEIMIAQSRHAAMGEMISMIAHQWRQPISVIAMDANNILADIELEMLDEVTLKDGAEDIIDQTQELSKTIDDFRNFFRPERVPEDILVQDIVADALGVIGKSLQNNNIKVVLEFDEIKKIRTYSRELMQVIINIIKNAKEVLMEKDIDEKIISIILKERKQKFTLQICDNAGGIDAEVITKIFDPYFTTKGDKNGTGLGLYMSRTIVDKHLGGSLKVRNENGGACFDITLPLSIQESGDSND